MGRPKGSKNSKGLSGLWLICPGCGKEHYRSLSDAHKTRCSVACKRVEREVRVCKRCGTSVEARITDRGRKQYCSAYCQRAEMHNNVTSESHKASGPKISSALLGHSVSKQTRTKISESHLKFWRSFSSDAIREKLRESGHNISEERREQLRTAMKNLWLDSNYRNKIIRAHLGKKLTEEHKFKISIANKGKIRSLEIRNKMSLTRIGVSCKPHTEEWKEGARQRMLIRRDDPNYEVPGGSISKVEVRFGAFLILCGFDVYNNVRVGKHRVDWFDSERKIVWEVDGELWHTDINKETKRDNEIISTGVSIVHISEKEVPVWKAIDRCLLGK